VVTPCLPEKGSVGAEKCDSRSRKWLIRSTPEKGEAKGRLQVQGEDAKRLRGWFVQGAVQIMGF
jgi:hypothetical protein